MGYVLTVRRPRPNTQSVARDVPTACQERNNPMIKMPVTRLLLAVASLAAVIGLNGCGVGTTHYFPDYGPRGYDYLYYPSVGIYYDNLRGYYYYPSSGSWVQTTVLPTYLYSGLGTYVVLINPGPRPWYRYDEHRRYYPPESYRHHPPKPPPGHQPWPGGKPPPGERPPSGPPGGAPPRPGPGSSAVTLPWVLEEGKGAGQAPSPGSEGKAIPGTPGNQGYQPWTHEVERPPPAPNVQPPGKPPSGWPSPPPVTYAPPPAYRPQPLPGTTPVPQPVSAPTPHQVPGVKPPQVQSWPNSPSAAPPSGTGGGEPIGTVLTGISSPGTPGGSGGGRPPSFNINY